MSYLIDTCVLSEVRRLAPDEAVQNWLREQPPEEMFISAITIGEIAKGVALLPGGLRKNQLREWLAVTREDFSDRILPIDGNVAQNWGELDARTRQRGFTVPTPDALIAATASSHGLRVATRNTRHFLDAGAAIFNPWTGEHQSSNA